MVPTTFSIPFYPHTRINRFYYRDRLTSIQTAGCSGPAHHGRYGTYHGAHPRVGDTQPLHGSVAAGVQEDVEGTQSPGQRINGKSQDGDPGDGARCSEGHRQKRTVGTENFT